MNSRRAPERARYSKVYPVGQFAGSPEWSPARREADAAERGSDPIAGKYLFLHDTYVVTEGMHADRAIVFDAVTPSWKAYCRDVMGFEPPE